MRNPGLIDARPLQGGLASRASHLPPRRSSTAWGRSASHPRLAVLLGRGRPGAQAISPNAPHRWERGPSRLETPVPSPRPTPCCREGAAGAPASPLPRRRVTASPGALPAMPVVVTVHDLIRFSSPVYLLEDRGCCAVRGCDCLGARGRDHRPKRPPPPGIASASPGWIPKIHVVPHGLSPQVPGRRPRRRSRRPRARHGLRRPYLPEKSAWERGTFEPRKGLPHLVAVTRRLRRDHDVDLVVAGQQGSSSRRCGPSWHAR